MICNQQSQIPLKRRTRRVSLLVLLLASASLMDVSAEDTPFNWQKDVTIPSTGQEEMISVMLDSDVYAATDDSLADIKLTAADGRVVPFLIRRRGAIESRVIRKTWQATNVSLKPHDDGHLELQFSLQKDDPVPTSLSIVTPLDNFEQTVSVSAIGSAGEDLPLASESLLFDYSAWMDVRKTTIALEWGDIVNARQFRVEIREPQSNVESRFMDLRRTLRNGEEVERAERTTIERRPFRIEHIDLIRDDVRVESLGDATLRWPVALLDKNQWKANSIAGGDAVPEMSDEIVQDPSKTVVLIQSRREPLTTFHVQTAAKNFSRHVDVQIPVQHGVRTTWQTIGSGTIRRFDFRELREQQLDVSFDERRSLWYRLVIDHRDNPPFEIEQVTGSGRGHELLALVGSNGGDGENEAASGIPAAETTSQSLHLLYGAESPEDVTAATYDLAAINAVLQRRVDPLPVEPGREERATNQPAAPANVGKALNNPVLLGSVIAILVALLAWALYGASRRVSSLPTEDRS